MFSLAVTEQSEGYERGIQGRVQRCWNRRRIRAQLSCRSRPDEVLRRSSHHKPCTGDGLISRISHTRCTKSQFRRRLPGVFLYLVGEMGMVIIPAFKGDVRKAFSGASITYFMQCVPETRLVNVFLGADADIVFKVSLQLTHCSKIFFRQRFQSRQPMMPVYLFQYRE